MLLLCETASPADSALAVLFPACVMLCTHALHGLALLEQVLGEVLQPGDRLLVAKGGKGGMGVRAPSRVQKQRQLQKEIKNVEVCGGRPMPQMLLWCYCCSCVLAPSMQQLGSAWQPGWNKAVAPHFHSWAEAARQSCFKLVA